jgi:hypothetical protein
MSGFGVRGVAYELAGGPFGAGQFGAADTQAGFGVTAERTLENHLQLPPPVVDPRGVELGQERPA